MHPPDRRRAWLAGIRVAVVFALIYMVFAELGLTWRTAQHGDAVFWGGSGLAAAVFSYTSPRLRWHLLGSILIAAGVINIYHGVAVPMAAGFALANAMEALVAGFWLGRRLPDRRRLVRLVDVGTLLGAAMMGAGVGSLIGGTTILLSGEGNLAEIATWYAGNAVGIVTIAPAVLAIASLKRDPFRGGSRRVVALIAAGALATLVISDRLSEVTGQNLAYLVLGPLLLAALWMGQRGTSLLVAAISLHMIVSASREVGPFAIPGSPLDPVIAAMFFKMVVQITVLTMAIEAGRRRDLIAEVEGILEAAVEAVLVVDETGTIRRANPGAAAMFVATNQNLIGTELSTHIPDVDSLVAQPTDQLSQVRGRRSDGTQFWAEISESGIAETSGRRRRAVIVRDVTDRIETESKVKRIQDEFVSNMTHELKTPLTAIIGFSDWLLSNPSSSGAAEDLQIIHTSALSLQELIDNILDFKRLSSTERETFTLDLEPLVEDIIAMNRTTAAERRVTLSSSPQSVASISGDRRQMQQAVRNLISNAVKYSKVGGNVDITLRDVGQSVVLTVTDDGIGISDQDQTRLFERFFRASNTGDIPGTGLGLVMVREIAEGHGGELVLTSKLGEGTKVEIRIPAIPTDPATR